MSDNNLAGTYNRYITYSSSDTPDYYTDLVNRVNKILNWQADIDYKFSALYDMISKFSESEVDNTINTKVTNAINELINDLNEELDRKLEKPNIKAGTNISLIKDANSNDIIINDTINLYSYAKKSEIPDVSHFAIDTDLTSHIDNENVHVTAAEKAKWNAKLDNTALNGYATETYVDNKIAEISINDTKLKYQGTNMYIDDNFSDTLIDEAVELYKKLNINSVILAYYIEVGSDWKCSSTLGTTKAAYAINTLEENGILFKGVKVHIDFNSSLDTSNIPDSFFTNYKNIIDAIMSLKTNDLSDSVIVFNESEDFTNYYMTNNLPKSKNFITSLKSQYKVSISMNYPQFQRADSEILNMLDFFAFNIYPAISSTGLDTTKERALSLLEKHEFFNTVNSVISSNKEIIISEIGCLDREVSLGAPEATGEAVEAYPFTGGKVKSFFYDCLLTYLHDYTEIDGVFLWDGVSEYRPYEDNVISVFNKYWKESRLI